MGRQEGEEEYSTQCACSERRMATRTLERNYKIVSKLLILQVVSSRTVGHRESGWRCQNAVGLIVPWFRMGQVGGAEGRSISGSDVENNHGRNSSPVS